MAQHESPAGRGGAPDQVTPEAVWAALDEVKDPEIPTVSVVEMGIVHDVRVEGDTVTITATPTFVGCPALGIIRRDIVHRVAAVPGVGAVQVDFVLDPPWTTERITPAGREKLRRFGIAPPPPLNTPQPLAELEAVPRCPFCGSGDTHLENVFGPTACRSIFYCDACKNPFEALKPV